MKEKLLLSVICTLTFASAIFAESRPALEWKSSFHEIVNKDLSKIEPEILDGCALATQHYYKKGMYCHLTLSSEHKLDKVRKYLAALDMKCCGPQYLPHHFNLTANEQNLAPGNIPPAIASVKAEVCWKKKGYNDKTPFNYRHVYLPTGMDEIFNILEGLNLEPGKNPTYKKMDFEGVSPENIITLAQYKGVKPIAYCFIGPTDTWSWYGRGALYLDVMKEAYGDKIEIILIATTVHDTMMGDRAFFGDIREDTPKNNRRIKSPAPHPLTIEERARRAKMFYMYYPNLTIDYYLDNMHQSIRDSYRDQGGDAQFV